MIYGCYHYYYYYNYYYYYYYFYCYYYYCYCCYYHYGPRTWRPEDSGSLTGGQAQGMNLLAMLKGGPEAAVAAGARLCL